MRECKNAPFTACCKGRIFVVVATATLFLFLRAMLRATRINGESALILRAQSTRKISALNEKCTSGMLPKNNLFYSNRILT
jgi:hypothetical protein